MNVNKSDERLECLFWLLSTSFCQGHRLMQKVLRNKMFRKFLKMFKDYFKRSWYVTTFGILILILLFKANVLLVEEQ